MVLLWDFRLLTPDLSQLYFPSPSGCCHLLVELPPPWCWGLLFFPFWPDDPSACPDLPWMQHFLSLWAGVVFDGDSGSVLCRRWRGLLAVTSRKCANIHWHLVIQMNMTLPLTIPSSGMWHILGCTEQGGSCLAVLRNVAHTLGCTMESGIHSWLCWGMWHMLLAALKNMAYS